MSAGKSGSIWTGSGARSAPDVSLLLGRPSKPQLVRALVLLVLRWSTANDSLSLKKELTDKGPPTIKQ